MKPVKPDAVRCVNCGLDIAWEPVVVDGKPYCCGGCAQGGPCYCSYDVPESDGSTSAEAEEAVEIGQNSVECCLRPEADTEKRYPRLTQPSRQPQ